MKMNRRPFLLGIPAAFLALFGVKAQAHEKRDGLVRPVMNLLCLPGIQKDEIAGEAMSGNWAAQKELEALLDAELNTCVKLAYETFGANYNHYLVEKPVSPVRVTELASGPRVSYHHTGVRMDVDEARQHGLYDKLAYEVQKLAMTQMQVSVMQLKYEPLRIRFAKVEGIIREVELTVIVESPNVVIDEHIITKNLHAMMSQQPWEVHVD